MKINPKAKRMGKGLTLVGTLGLCLMLSGCYIPPDEIAAGTENMTIGSNSLPFNPIPTATQKPTATPTQRPTDTPNPGDLPVINWDDWGGGSTATATPTPATGGSIVVVTQKPTATPAPATPTPTSSSLRKGSTGERVREVQRRLKTLGYLTGSADGDFGEATEAAVIAFQKNNGLTADGVVGSKTLQKLNSSSAVPASKSSSTATKKPSAAATKKPSATATPKVDDVYLEIGSSGSKVRQLQNRLIDLGYLVGKADGEFGGTTQAAVKAFQERMDLWADGIAGPNTLKKLYSSSARSASDPAAYVGGTLEEGDNGEGVRLLQKRLKKLGYYSGSVDGDYGEGTTAAVKAFQLNNNLKADGKAGTATMNKLFEEDLVKESDAKDTADQISSTGYVTLREGDEGDNVRKLQKKLKEKGYYSGSVDGSFGSGTVNAVMAFQRANNLTVDGVAGPSTQRALYGTSSSISYATLRPGDSGSAVTNMQYALYELGYYDGSIDGKYGDTTEDAVRAFQIQNNLSPVDGVAGNKTLQKLYSSSARSATTVSSKYETLRPGDTGGEVIELQECLKQLNYPAVITGVYDDDTKAAVKLFQQNNGLSVDGIAGAATQQKLYSGNAKPN